MPKKDKEDDICIFDIGKEINDNMHDTTNMISDKINQDIGNAMDYLKDKKEQMYDKE